MSFTSIGSFNSGLWKGGGSTNTVSGITVVNYYTEAYISWNAVRNATGYQISLSLSGTVVSTYTTTNIFQLFTGLTDNTGYTLSITAYVGGSYGPPKASSFTTLKLPYSSTVPRTISSNGIDSVWSFIDSTNILDFYIYSDICLNIILVGAGGYSSNFQGGGGAQVSYLNQYRVYNYYNTSPTITKPYKANIFYQGGGAAGWGIYLDSFITGFYFDVINFSGQYALNGLFTDTTNRGQGYKLVDMTGNGNDVFFGPYSGGTSFSTTGGGGGGGAGGVGGNATSGVGGNGGPGIGFTINNVAYGPYGGGGGGYGTVQSGTGKDGGGNGGINGNGVAYTGGGPGGSQSTAQQNRGGSGIVVIVGTTSLLPSVVSGFSYGNLVGNATTNSYSVDISYNQSVNNVAGYCIQFNGNVKNTTSGLTGNSFVFNSPTKLTNNYSGLNGNTAYTISAYTIGTYGNSAITNITIPQLTLPPTNLIGNTTTTTNNSISFSFTPPTTIVSSYIATAIDVSNSSLIYSNTIAGNTTSATISGLQMNKTYIISMIAINSYGKSISSNSITFSTELLSITGGSYTKGTTIIGSTNYVYYMLAQTGVSYTVSSNNLLCNILAVGGGGGGGAGAFNYSTFDIAIGGGGGGGNCINTQNYLILSSITVNIGTGGLGGRSTGRFSSNGGDTTLRAGGNIITAYGGGYGASFSYINSNSLNSNAGTLQLTTSGGGGGGAGMYGALYSTFGLTLSGQNGYSSGGSARKGYYPNGLTTYKDLYYASGGGGGATGVGNNGSISVGINGTATSGSGGNGYYFQLLNKTYSKGGNGASYAAKNVGNNLSASASITPTGNAPDGINYGDGGNAGSCNYPSGWSTTNVQYNGGNGVSGFVCIYIQK
jgi:hypothetical protein